MPVLISLLRGINLINHNRIKMDELRKLYESLKLRQVETHIASGNVVFVCRDQNLAKLAKRIEDQIEKSHGFRPSVILRTPEEMRDAIARNPFAERQLNPSNVLVTFLATHPSAEACAKVRAIKADPEELHLDGREVYIYFPNGQGQSNLSWVSVEKALKVRGTGRNWRVVLKLLEIAEKLEASS